MRNYTPAFLLAMTVLLAGCIGKPASDPTPAEETAQRNQQSRLAVSPVGQPLEVDGCLVKVHDVHITRPGVALDSNFTLATANCPAAQVTTAREVCGKGCVHNTVRVDRLSEADLNANAQAEAQAQANAARAQQAAKRRQEIEAKIAELQKQLSEEWAPHELILAK
jgi:hypothetical protein